MNEYKYEFAGHTLKPNHGLSKCSWCENTQRTLRAIREIENGEGHNICYDCEDKIKGLIKWR